MTMHRWELGALDLVNADGISDPYWFETIADGFDLGTPEAVRVVLSTLAADGDDERIQRHANRTVVFVVEVKAPDSEALAAGERALALEVGKINTLSWTPPDDFGKTSVFDVRTSVMKFEMRDLELLRSTQTATYTVTLTCAPFARPVDPTTISLTYSTVTSGTVMDSGASTTDWTLDPSYGAKTLSTTTYLAEAALKVTPTTPRVAGFADTDLYIRSSLALTAANPYLAVVVAADPGNYLIDSVALELNGQGYGPVAVEILASGAKRFFFAHSRAGTTVTARFAVRWQYAYAPTTQASYILGVEAWPSAPATGLNVFDVGGSQRAPFSLMVGRGDAGDLGRVGVFSDPEMLASGYNPSQSNTWATAPAGTYTVVMPAGGSGTNLYSLTINGQTDTTRSPASGVPLFFEFHLGARRDGTLGPLTITHTINGTPSATPTLWLFRKADDTSLTLLKSVAFRYLWVDSPTLDAPHVGLWAGTAADGSDAASVATEAYCADPMHLAPAVAALWISTAVTTTTVDSQITYYPRSHTFVA